MFYAFGAMASAATYTCSGKVKFVALSPKGGMLQVNAGHGVHYLCRIHTESNGVPPEVCQAWYSMFLTAQSRGVEMHQSYNSDHGNAANLVHGQSQTQCRILCL
ncbi:MAG: hypothetical protein ACFHVJ_00755 [Aestuariibacter sp.]